MGSKSSQPVPPLGGLSWGGDQIPPDSPLELILKYWGNNSWTKDKKKGRIIKYCCSILTQTPNLPPSIFWPKFGWNEDWICQLLIQFVQDKSLGSQEGTYYAVGGGNRWSYFPSEHRTKREMRRKPKNILGSPPLHGTPLARCCHLTIPKMPQPPGSAGRGGAQRPPPRRKRTASACGVNTGEEGC